MMDRRYFGDIGRALESILPKAVGSCCAVSGDYDSMPDHHDEIVTVSRVPEKRRREFKTGRECARLAMVKLGLKPCAIPRSLDRSPRWPNGVVGSISHSDDICVAIVAQVDSHLSIGIDVQSKADLQNVFQYICTDNEYRRILDMTKCEQNWGANIIFSAKEAFYKAFYTVHRRKIGFRDVEVDISFDQFSLNLVALPQECIDANERWLGRFAIVNDYVLSVFSMSVGSGREINQGQRSDCGSTCRMSSW